MSINYITPAVTPITEKGKIDFDSCVSLYGHLLKGGTDGILVLGSIGEFFGFTKEERKKLISFAADKIKGKTELIAGTASMVYDETVELSLDALNSGADAVIILPPYYFSFGEDSIYDYYAALAEDIPGRIYTYNFPERTGYEIPADTVLKLAERFENIVGIKDTIGGMDHTREIIKKVKGKRPDFLVYSGFDDNFTHNALCGGNGCIAGLSNLCPQVTSALCRAVREKDFEKAALLQKKIDRLMDIYSVGKPFVPFIKEALKIKGVIKCANSTKPMPTPGKAQSERIREILIKEGI